MKKRVLAMFMAALVTVGTVLAPADMGSAYAAEVTQEETEKSAAEALLENETPGVTVETETSETEEIQTTEGKEIPETQMVEETSETEEAAETQTVEVIAETEETVDVQTTGENEARSATLSEMPTGLLPFEAVGEITLDRETAEEEEAENILKSSAYYNSTWEKYGSYYFYNQLSS